MPSALDKKVPGNRFTLHHNDLEYVTFRMTNPIIPIVNGSEGIKLIVAYSGAIYIYGLPFNPEDLEYLRRHEGLDDLPLKELSLAPEQLEELVQVINTETGLTIPEQVYSRTVKKDSEKRLEIALIGDDRLSQTKRMLYANFRREG